MRIRGTGPFPCPLVPFEFTRGPFRGTGYSDPRSVLGRLENSTMDDQPHTLYQADEEILISTVSDEALEAAAEGERRQFYTPQWQTARGMSCIDC